MIANPAIPSGIDTKPLTVKIETAPDFETITACLSCGNRDLAPIISLGPAPLSNAFLNSPDQPEELYPLDLVLCACCSMAQIAQTVSPQKLFSHYLYFSSQSNTMLEHARELAEQVIAARKLDKQSLVIEIGSNDGYLLQHFMRRHVPVLGIEPAQNIAEQANADGIPTRAEFFNEELARDLPKADVVIALNVLAHVADLTGMVRGIRAALKNDGIAIIEVPYVRDMIENVEVDTIYHEHLCYFSLTALQDLFKRYGLVITHAERVDIHGGSLRVVAAKMEGRGSTWDAGVVRLLDTEHRLGITSRGYYADFATRVEVLRRKLIRMLLEMKTEGKSIAAYGAAAKGVMLLHLIGANRGALKGVPHVIFDSTPAKQGKFTPGSHVHIQSVAGGDLQPDVILLLAWNFAREIIGKHSEYRGQWIVPVPEPRVIDPERKG